VGVDAAPVGRAGTGPMSRADHLAEQRAFYEDGAHEHLRPRRGDRYAARIVGELVRQAGIRPHDRVLELGAGFGRFTFPLLAHCRSVLAVDLSRRVLAALAAERDARGVPADRCPTLCADVDALTPDVVGAPPDFVVGVFFLHHLADFRRTLARLAGLVAPGGGLAFVEPNRRNPLFLFQIACCPGMRWGEERGLYRVGEHDLRAAIAASGLADARTRTFGFFPPQVLNRFAAAERLERRLERWRPLRPLLPFVLASGRRELDVPASRR